jgi:hypothetical protein
MTAKHSEWRGINILSYTDSVYVTFVYVVRTLSAHRCDIATRGGRGRDSADERERERDGAEKEREEVAKRERERKEEKKAPV